MYLLQNLFPSSSEVTNIWEKIIYFALRKWIHRTKNSWFSLRASEIKKSDLNIYFSCFHDLRTWGKQVLQDNFTRFIWNCYLFHLNFSTFSGAKKTPLYGTLTAATDNLHSNHKLFMYQNELTCWYYTIFHPLHWRQISDDHNTFLQNNNMMARLLLTQQILCSVCREIKTPLKENMDAFSPKWGSGALQPLVVKKGITKTKWISKH